jgi:hypothetical protein
MELFCNLFFWPTCLNMLFWMCVNGVKWTGSTGHFCPFWMCVSLGVWTGSGKWTGWVYEQVQSATCVLSVSVTAYVVWASVIIQGVNRWESIKGVNGFLKLKVSCVCACVCVCTCRYCACRCTSFFLGTTCAWKICRSEKWGSSSSIGWDHFFSVFTAAMPIKESDKGMSTEIIGCILIVVLMHSFTAHCHQHPLFYPSVTNNAWIRNWDTSDFSMLVVCNREWHINIQKAFLPPCHG